MIEISQPADQIIRALQLTPGRDALVNVTLDEDGAVFVFRQSDQEHRIMRGREEVLHDLGVTGAQLSRVRFENDIVYWGLIPL